MKPEFTSVLLDNKQLDYDRNPLWGGFQRIRLIRLMSSFHFPENWLRLKGGRGDSACLLLKNIKSLFICAVSQKTELPRRS